MLGEPLSARELQVLRLVADGLTNEAVGRRLFLEQDTVRTHMFRIGKKLGASGRTNAVWLAATSGQLRDRQVPR